MDVIKNPLRGIGLGSEALQTMAEGDVSLDAAAAQALYRHCPVAHRTDLDDRPDLARYLGVARLALKREEGRMGLGSFKALGATYAIAKIAAARASDHDPDVMKSALADMTFLCCSAGNHGLSLAAGAALFGARAVVVLADTVPESFADRLRAKGADVIRFGADYEEGMAHSRHLAQKNGWFLLSDGSWAGYSDPARDVMEGYLIMGHEAGEQWPQVGRKNAPPTHVMLQAGVGGLAAAGAVMARAVWGDAISIIVVEPNAAPALIESVRAGEVVDTVGPVSTMGRLDCKTPSHLALKYLAREADWFVTLSDEAVADTVTLLADHDISSTPSGVAGVAALHHAREALNICEDARILAYISEGAD